MQNSPRTLVHDSSSTATGWLLSCLLHGGLALATIFFVQRIHLAPQGDLFQWNVAMVATLSPSATTTAPVAQTTPPTKHTPSSARPVQRIDSTPIASAPATPPAELAPLSQQVAPLQNEPNAPELTPSPPQSMPSSEHASVPHTDISQSPASASEMGSTSDPLLSTNTPVATTSSQRSANIDYGWLAALMAQWIEGLDKRYPAALRAEGIEGKVTLIALLHEDGSLSDVRIAKGSGNAALDQIALEDVRNGSPVKLAHPLERPQISVKFSISYDLRTTR
jgi:periplasmic protein TonB